MEPTNLIFLHGGPGFNSNPEAHLMGPYLQQLGHETFFWNEPSVLRPGQDFFDSSSPFLGNVKSAEKFIYQTRKNHSPHLGKITVMAHSFSVHYVYEILTKFDTQIDELILFAPAFDIHTADLNIFQLAAEGLKSQGVIEKSHQLTEAISQLQDGFDDHKYNSFLLAAEYGSLFTHYWKNQELMQRYFSFLGNEFSFDLTGMLQSRQAMPQTFTTLTRKIEIPTKIYFGSEDPVTKPSEQLKRVGDYFQDPEIIVLENCRHFPHLEQMEEIFN